MTNQDRNQLTPAVQRVTEQINATLGNDEPASPAYARSLLDIGLDVEYLASVTHTAATAWRADREAYGLDSRDYDHGMFVALCLRAALLGGAS